MRRPALLEVAFYGVALLAFGSGRILRTETAPPFEPGVRSEAHLRVVTWNVGGVDEAGAARPLSDGDVAHVVGVLRALDADLIALQEIARHAQRRTIERALGEGWESASPDGDGARVAVFVRGADFVRFAVPGAGARALGLVLEHEVPARAPVVVALHADAFSSDERNDLIGAACDLLFERARAAPPGSRPRLLIGDLNLDLDLDKRGDLFSDDQYRDVETYNYVAAVLLDAARGNGSTAEPDRRLDYVFVDETNYAVQAAGPWKGRRAAGMDHDPVVADLEPR